MNKLQPNTSTTFATPPAAVATPTSQCFRCQGLINEHCRCACGNADPDVGSGGDAPIDVTDPWRGLYRSEHLRANGDGDLYHPDMPSWPDDREDALDKLVHAQGFDFQVVAGDFSDEAIEDGDELYWQEMRAWNPEAPEGDWRLAWKGDTEDGPYAWFVRPMALRPAPEALAARQPVGVSDSDVHLAAQMLTWGRDEGLTTQQELEVEAHQKKLFDALGSHAPPAPATDDDETPEPTALQIAYAEGYGAGVKDGESRFGVPVDLASYRDAVMHAYGLATHARFESQLGELLDLIAQHAQPAAAGGDA